MIEDLDEEILDFYEKHCAEPGGVVLAQFCYEDGSHDTGIFSTLALADLWVNGLHSEEEGAAMFVPYVIDVPEYGNTTKKEMN